MQKHECPENRHEEIEVIYDPSKETGWESWILRVYRVAKEKDVYDGEADEVGEIMSETYFTITFCPFCGKRLDELN